MTPKNPASIIFTASLPFTLYAFSHEKKYINSNKRDNWIICKLESLWNSSTRTRKVWLHGNLIAIFFNGVREVNKELLVSWKRIRLLAKEKSWSNLFIIPVFFHLLVNFVWDLFMQLYFILPMNLKAAENSIHWILTRWEYSFFLYLFNTRMIPILIFAWI